MGESSAGRRPWWRRIAGLLFVPLAAASVGVGVAPVGAAGETFTVNSLLDLLDTAPGDGICKTGFNSCSFRAAVQESNALPGRQRIVSTVYESKITRVGVDDTNLAGDFDITGDVVIEQVNLNANQLDRAIDIHNGAVVEMTGSPPGGSGTTLHSGTTPGDGGGIRVLSGSLSLTNYVVQNNSASAGGGVANVGGSVTITGGSLHGNTATGAGGGGLGSLGGDASVAGTLVRSNRAPAGVGGGIAVVGGSLDVGAGTRMVNNSAAGVGGGLATTVPATVAGTTFEGNTARVGGGAFALHDLAMTASTVTGNHAVGTNAYGGGLALNGLATTVSATTINDNGSTQHGGGVVSLRSLALEGSLVRGNEADGVGGGVGIVGNATIGATTIVDNHADAAAGGVANFGTVAIAESAVLGNSAPRAGGVGSVSSLSITRSAIADNSAATAGGGIAASGALTVDTSTFARNSAPAGGAIDSQHAATITQTTIAGTTSTSGAVTGAHPSLLRGTIVAGSTGPNCGAGDVDSAGFNISDDATCPLGAAGDHNSTDPLLGPQVGPGAAIAFRPGAGSAAVDGGPPTCATPDQLGASRPIDGNGDAVAACDIGALEVLEGRTFLVVTTADAVDDNIGDGICRTAGGACSLRAAVQESNARPSDDTIVLAGATHDLTIAGADDIAAVGDLDITDVLTIEGAGATVAQRTSCRVVHVSAGVGVRLDGITIAFGNVAGLAPTCDHAGIGGGILTDGVLELVGVTVTSNRAQSGSGIYNVGVLRVSESVIRENGWDVGDLYGGGLYNLGQATIEQSSFVANVLGENFPIGSNDLFGGGVYNAGTLDISMTSFVSNGVSPTQTSDYGGDAIANVGSLSVSNSSFDASVEQGTPFGPSAMSFDGVTFASSLFAFTQPGPWYAPIAVPPELITVRRSIFNGPCESPVASGGGNVFRDATCGTAQPSDLVGVDPLLADGEGTGPGFPVFPLPAASPAVDHVAAPCLPVDQRGTSRPQGAACDAGAYERTP